MLFPYRFANILMVSGSKPDGALDPADSHLIAQMCHNIEPHAPVTALRESFHGREAPGRALWPKMKRSFFPEIGRVAAGGTWLMLESAIELDWSLAM